MTNEKKNLGAETIALCELLGRLDCAFWPQFPIDCRNRTVCWEWAKAWIDGVGLPLRTSNATVNERKRVEIMWKSLEKAGLITITSRKGRRSHVRFTLLGETIARGLCATGDVFTNWDVLEAFVTLCDEVGEDSLPASFVAGVEPWTGAPEDGKELGRQTFRFLPHATAGHVDFTMDTLGHLWLTITAAGRKSIDNPPTKPEGYDDWHLIEEASDVYEASFTAARQELAIAKPDHPTNFIIPRVPTGWGGFLGYLELVRKHERERKREASQ